MRNLKKILALVLALVMSLSLMATANAGSFSDVADGNTYKTAIEVLDGLKVFQGYEDGSFKPENNLNRAQAAVLVYRIATGDAEDQYVANYTDMAQTKFTDLDGYNWARGYINYCQNAEIIKGKTPTTFDPGADVTGYQLMAMILRAMGYGKNGEFEGTGWELQTATIAERIGIVAGIAGGDGNFGEPASRALTAQILFNALLTEMVDYTMLNGYTPNGKTLGKEQFGLEYLKGVVMANQWAALDAEKVMAVDSTRMLVTEVQVVGSTAKVGDTITLDSATDLEAVGMTYVAYVAGKTADKQTLTLAEDPINKVGFNKGQAINTNYSDEKFEALKDLGVALDNKTEYYVNYEEDWVNDAVSDFLIRYVVRERNLQNAVDGKYITSTTRDDYIKYLTSSTANGGPKFVTLDNTTAPNRVWTVTIQPEQNITKNDQAIMKEIFYTADRYLEFTQLTSAYELGEVFVGTATTKDVSDTMSWNQFTAEYFNDTKTYKKFDSAENGESVRIIDNDGDGVAEYALKVTYTMDQVAGTYKNALALNSEAFANYSEEKNTLVIPELAVGDVVVYSKIDGQLHVRKVEPETDKIKTHSFKDITITTASDNTYGQSGITNKTGMDDKISQMSDTVEYTMYKDLFDYVRAYKGEGSKYALLTEVYHSGTWNDNYVVNNSLIAEVKIGDAAIAEYAVSNPNGNVFNSSYPWSSSINRYDTSNLNYLQPAIAHLGYLNNGTSPDPNYPSYFAGATTPTSLADAESNIGTKAFAYTAWTRNVWQMANVSGNYGVFDYGTENYGTGSTDHSSTFTNVAAYTQTGDKAMALNTASQLFTDTNGEQVFYMGQSGVGVNSKKTTMSQWLAANPGMTTNDWADKLQGTNRFGNNGNYERFYRVYKTDYVQLALSGDSNGIAVKANTNHYAVPTTYREKYHTFTGGVYPNNTYNSYVNATVDTEFYIVMPGYGNTQAVQYVKGIADLPTIKASNIRAAYAVATNTIKSSTDNDYWVADVIVIETTGLEYGWDSVSLMYYSQYEATGSVFNVDSLNNQWRTYQPDSALRAKITVTPSASDVTGAYTAWTTNNFGWQTGAYGFYTLERTNAAGEGSVTAGNAKRITANFNDYGVYAGYVTEIAGLQSTGYINVDISKTGSGNTQTIWVDYAGNSVPFYRITTDYNNRVNVANEINLHVIDRYNDVQIGDPIIWVYEKGSSKLAFVVDLATRYTNGVADFIVPSWLYNGADFSSRYFGNVVANPTSEFGKICKDEIPTNSGNTSYTVTFKTTNVPDGVNLPRAFSTSYSVGGNGSVTIPASDFAVTTAMTNAGFNNITFAGGNASMVGAGNPFTVPTGSGVDVLDYSTAVTVTVPNSVQNKSIVIEVTYPVTGYDISLVSGGVTAPVTSVTAAYKDATLADQTGIALTTGALTDKAAAQQQVTLTINLSPALAATQELIVEVTNLSTGGVTRYGAQLINGSDRDVATCTFTMPNANVEVEAKVKANTVTVDAPNVTSTPPLPTTDTLWTGAYPGNDTTLTAAAGSGYTVSGWVITDTDTGAVLAQNTDVNKTTIPANAVTAAVGAGKNITVTVKTEMTTQEVTFTGFDTLTSVTGYKLWVGEEEVTTFSASFIKNVKVDTVIKIQMTKSAAGGTVTNPTVPTGASISGGAVVGATDTYEWIITNIGADGTIAAPTVSP